MTSIWRYILCISIIASHTVTAYPLAPHQVNPSIPLPNGNIRAKHFPIHSGNTTLPPTNIVLSGGAIEGEGSLVSTGWIPQLRQWPIPAHNQQRILTPRSTSFIYPIRMEIGQAARNSAQLDVPIPKFSQQTHGYRSTLGIMHTHAIGTAK